MDSNSHLFWEMVKPEYQPLHRFCCRLIGSDDDGADLCQDVLVRAHRGFGQLKDPKAFKGWLYQIAVNEFRSRIKRPWWSRVIPISDSILAGMGGTDPLPRHTGSRLLQVGFRAVTAEDQALIVMFEVEGWTAQELARMTGRSEAATRMRLSRIRKRIKERLVRHLKSSRNVRQDSKELTVNSVINEDQICVVNKPGLD